jgi:hypothetical protein
MEQGHTGGCTVIDAELLVTPFRLAVMLVELVELPEDCPVARPVLLMVAATGLEEFHTTCDEIS